jgi:hypothetical protein
MSSIYFWCWAKIATILLFSLKSPSFAKLVAHFRLHGNRTSAYNQPSFPISTRHDAHNGLQLLRRTQALRYRACCLDVSFHWPHHAKTSLLYWLDFKQHIDFALRLAARFDITYYFDTLLIWDVLLASMIYRLDGMILMLLSPFLEDTICASDATLRE